MMNGIRSRYSHRRCLQRSVTLRLFAFLAWFGIHAIPAETCHSQCKPIPIDRVSATDGSRLDFFEISVAIDGQTMVVGAPGDSTEFGDEAGAVYVFIRSGDQWIQQARLVDPFGGPYNSMGTSIAIDGDTIVVGAHREGDGTVSVFVRSGTTWAWQAKLVPQEIGALDYFGRCVAIDGDTLVAGAPRHDGPPAGCGAAFVFVRSGTTWTQQQRLLASDAAFSDQFGGSVTIDGDTLAVGAAKNDTNFVDSGAAYVFARQDAIWTEQSRLVAIDGNASDGFGASVAIHDDLLLVGAPGHVYHPTIDNGGAAYVFNRINAVWSEQTQLFSLNSGPADLFGSSVAVDRSLDQSETTVIVGGGSVLDEVLLFVRTGDGGWGQQFGLQPAKSDQVGRFGDAVGIDGGQVTIACYESDPPTPNGGAAYVFDVGCAHCFGDLAADGAVNVGDLLAVISHWGHCPNKSLCHWDISPTNGDDVVDVQDLLAVIAAWGPCR